MANKQRKIRIELWLLPVVIVILALAIVIKIWIYKVVEYNKWSKLQQKYVFKIKTIPATRGNILSENNYVLVTSVPFYEVRWDARVENLTNEKFSKNVDSLACCLGKIFNKPSDYFFKKLLKARTIGNRYTLIARRVNYTQLEKIKKCPIFSWGKYKGGLIINTNEVRAKSFEYSSRTLGYKKEDGTGIGIEKAYDKYLRGIDGKKLVQKISGKYYREVKNADNIDPKNGYDIRTTLNVEIEDITHNSLLRMLKATQADHGVAVVMEVKTGDIKAISNLGRTKDGNYEEKYNYAIGELYEPGSTFKLASMIVALDKGVVDLYDTVDTKNGTIKYYNHIMRDAHRGLGKIPVIEAFAHSSNVGISQIIYNNFKDHPEDFIDRLYAMHLNDVLGIEIKGEKRPVIHYPGDKYWSGISLPQISIGYEVRITPLQLLTLYNAVANGGKMVKPRFVSAVLKQC
jgi:cell division protein FtsI (penicillin-binding protein 3)